MAYSPIFPTTYQPMGYYPQQQSFIQPPQQNNNGGIIWVTGEAGAKSYLVAPNTTVQLWDSENQCIYLKSADASGMPSIKTLDYTIRQDGATSPVQAIQKQDGINVSKSDLDALQSQIDALRSELDGLKNMKGEKANG